MRNSKDRSVARGELARIDRAFRAFRRRRPAGPLNYPPKLKRLAVQAVRHGNSIGRVARSAGVSEPSIGNWLKVHKEEVPQELTLVPDGSSPVVPLSIDDQGAREAAPARIFLRSGAVIEVPVGALTSSLIAAINGGCAG